MEKIHWGIIGLGKIAHKMAHDLKLAADQGAVLYGVASRDIQKAQAFANEYQAQKAYGSYDELIADPKIQAVYIATPHVFHCHEALKCLEAKKAVLCEKPLAMDLAEVKKLVEASKKHQTFLMEAMWTRFLPSTLKVMEMVQQGLIGNLVSIRADFGYKVELNPKGRLFDKKLGGGALLDIGIYPLFIAQLFLGKPTAIKALATFGPTGVDHVCNMVCQYEGGQTAILDSSMEAFTPAEAWIHGDKGSIKMHHRFHHATTVTLYQEYEKLAEHHLPYTGNGYYHEALEVMDCLRAQRLESKKMSHADSLMLIESLDKARHEIGLTY